MPDFKQYLLKETKGSTAPVRTLFYDCETKHITNGNKQYHKMYMGWTYYTRRDLDPGMVSGRWIFHDSRDSICQYIESLEARKTTLYIFGHNIFFDLQASGFFAYFPPLGWKLNFVYDSGLSYILVIKKDQCTIKVLSTTNYFAESLASIGEHFGVPKTEIDFEKSSYAEIKEYCKNDVAILIKTMAEWFAFIKKHDCGSFGLTRASQSFRAFRHRFMKESVTIHQDPEVIALERNCYTGGRTEAFYVGLVPAGEISAFDVNSMYPSIMQENDFPIQLIDHIKNPDMRNLPNLLKSFCICAHILVDTDKPAYAVRDPKKILFPTGIFPCYVTTRGLQFAIVNGHLRQVYEISVYKKANIFKSYVDYFYPLKQQAKLAGDSITGAMVKTFLNSLYGKFGQKAPIVTTEDDNRADNYSRIEILDIDTGEIETHTRLFGKLVIEKGEKNGKDSMVAIAAHVTEIGRFLLFDAISTQERSKVLYSDTDSIYLHNTSIADSHLDYHPSDLGKWSLDGRQSHMLIYGCKDYEFGDEIKIKGVPRRAEKISDGVYRYHQFLGQSSHLRAGEKQAYIVQEVTKTNKRLYDKAKVLQSGYTIPYIMIGDVLHDPLTGLPVAL